MFRSPVFCEVCNRPVLAHTITELGDCLDHGRPYSEAELRLFAAVGMRPLDKGEAA